MIAKKPAYAPFASKWSALPSALAITLSIIGFGYAAHSLWLGFTLAHPLPFGDQWYFVRDYFKYLDGEYSWRDLFSQHNEHRIVTTRIVLFADAMLFRMRGLLPVGVIYASLGTAALICARLIAQPGLNRLAALGLALGLFWSTSQWVDLVWQFQVQFALVHLFALATLVALLRATQTGLSRWTAAAIATDGLAVASLGSGLLLVAPALLLGIWLRSGRPVVILAAFHILFVGMYFWGYHPPSQSSFYFFEAGTFFRTTAEFIGEPFGKHELVFGCAGIVLLAALAIHISYLVISRQPLDQACCVFAAAAVFVLIEALVIGYARGGYGTDPHYATASVFFWVTLLAALWQMTRDSRVGLLVPCMAVGAVIVMNAPAFEASWREQVGFLSRVTQEVRRDVFDPVSMRRLYEHEWTAQAVARLRKLELGPFAAGR
jgi:hypothetical protein